MIPPRCVQWAIVLLVELSSCVGAPIEDAKVSYAGHRVLRLRVTSVPHVNLLWDLVWKDTHDVELWGDPAVNHTVDMRVGPPSLVQVTALLEQEGLPYITEIQDLQQLIEHEAAWAAQSAARVRGKRSTFLSKPSFRRHIHPAAAVTVAAASPPPPPPKRNKKLKKKKRRRKKRKRKKHHEKRSYRSGGDKRHLWSSSLPGSSSNLFFYGHRGFPSRRRSANYFYWFTVVGRYATYSEIKDWLYYASYTKPHIARVIDMGLTGESRPMKLLKIGRPGKQKPAIWLDGGIHAREWIAPAVIVYIIHLLIDGYNYDPEITDLVDKYDWFLLPVVNPDGYTFSHTADRLWRKTRSRPVADWSRCQGVDLNRNFNYYWMGHCNPYNPEQCRGVHPCDSSFAGKTPFSEIEARNMADFLYRHRGVLQIYLSFHSYSQMWLTPWGYTENAPRDINKLMKMAKKAVTAMKTTHGTDYVYGSPAQLLYTAGGGSFDWAKGIAGIEHAYAVELRDRGTYGFLLPQDQIIPTGQEVWEGVKAAVKALEEEKVQKIDSSIKSNTEVGGGS